MKRCRSRNALSKNQEVPLSTVISLRASELGKTHPRKHQSARNQYIPKRVFICFGAFISSSIYRLVHALDQWLYQLLPDWYSALIVSDVQNLPELPKLRTTSSYLPICIRTTSSSFWLPTALQSLQVSEERSVDRFKWGMVAELEKPTVELQNIHHNKIHRDGCNSAEWLIILLKMWMSVRDLEGISLLRLWHVLPFSTKA